MSDRWIRKLGAGLLLAGLSLTSSHAVTLNPDVTPQTIHRTICVKGYTETVRPSTSYTNGIKFRLMREAGIPEAEVSMWALDHKVALVLGGHPRALDNLQLLTARENRRKARVEVKLQCLVCSGQVSLGEAQGVMEGGWKEAYREYARRKCDRSQRSSS